MSKLVAPGVGEIVDRLQILALKILYSAERGKASAHFKKEHDELLTLLLARNFDRVGFTATLELAAVHAALWHKTDELRDCKTMAEGGGNPVFWKRVAILGLQIMELNDQRATCVRTINELAGEPADGDEKL